MFVWSLRAAQAVSHTLTSELSFILQIDFKGLCSAAQAIVIIVIDFKGLCAAEAVPHTLALTDDLPHYWPAVAHRLNVTREKNKSLPFQCKRLLFLLL